jgi:hypothetical protein
MRQKPLRNNSNNNNNNSIPKHNWVGRCGILWMDGRYTLPRRKEGRKAKKIGSLEEKDGSKPLKKDPEKRGKGRLLYPWDLPHHIESYSEYAEWNSVASGLYIVETEGVRGL